MDDFTRCTKCDEYDFSSTHKCADKWKVFHKEYMDEEFNTIYALDAEEAAKKYGEEYDIGNYELLDGGEIEIQVEPFDGGDRKTFIVMGETEPVYYAKEKE